MSGILEGKVAFVTGSATGLGRASSMRLQRPVQPVSGFDVEAGADELPQGWTSISGDVSNEETLRQPLRASAKNSAGWIFVVANAGLVPPWSEHRKHRSRRMGSGIRSQCPRRRCDHQTQRSAHERQRRVRYRDGLAEFAPRPRQAMPVHGNEACGTGYRPCDRAGCRAIRNSRQRAGSWPDRDDRVTREAAHACRTGRTVTGRRCSKSSPATRP